MPWRLGVIWPGRGFQYVASYLVAFGLYGPHVLAASDDGLNRRALRLEWRANWEPLKMSESNFQEYMDLRRRSGATLRPQLLRRMELVEAAITAYPEWIDGLWIWADDALQYAGSLHGEEVGRDKKEIYQRIVDRQNACLKRVPDHPLCTFNLAVAHGQLASLNGIMSEIFATKRIHELYLKVYRSGFDFVYPEGFTLQNFVRTALGILYRVLPDSWIAEFALGVRGNLQRSIALHREAVETSSGRSPCYHLLLAASLVCHDSGESQVISQEAQTIFSHIAEAPSLNTMEIQCKSDAERLVAHPGTACDYTLSPKHAVSEMTRKSKEQ